MPQQTARLPGYWMPVFAGMTSELLPGESPPAYSRRALNQVEADGDSTRGVLVRVSLKLDALLQLAAAHGANRAICVRSADTPGAAPFPHARTVPLILPRDGASPASANRHHIDASREGHIKGTSRRTERSDASESLTTTAV